MKGVDVVMKKHKKECWVFYLISNEPVCDVLPNQVYAITDNVEYANSFIKTRNMDMFYPRSLKMNIHDFNRFLEKNISSMLKEVHGYTRVKKKYKPEAFSIVLTVREESRSQNLLSLYMNEFIYRNVWNDPTLLKTKYQKALNTLLYNGLHNFLENGEDELWEDTISRMCPKLLNIILHDYKDLFIYEKRGD